MEKRKRIYFCILYPQSEKLLAKFWNLQGSQTQSPGLSEVLSILFTILKAFSSPLLSEALFPVSTAPPALHLGMRAVQEAELPPYDSCHLLWNVLCLWDLACDGRFSYYPQLGFYWRIIPCRPCLSLAFECSKLAATLLFPTHFSATRKKALTLYFYLLFCYSKKAQNCSTSFLNWFLSFSTTRMAGYSEDLSIGFAFRIFSFISPITCFSDTIFSRSCLIRDPIMRDILSQWILVLPKTSAVRTNFVDLHLPSEVTPSIALS